MPAKSHIAFEIPGEIGRRLEERWGDLSRGALEALAAEGYRSGVLSEDQVQHLLDLPSRWAVDAFLKAHQCYLDYDEEDLARDVASIRRISHP